MLRLIGRAAHSKFRLASLLSHIQTIFPQIISVDAWEEYYVYTTGEFDTEANEKLCTILQTRTNISLSPEMGRCCWVIPRWGTQSAWGTKARDILINVGYSSIERIERAIGYCIEGGEWTSKDWAVVEAAGILHDRMTESMITQWQEAEKLFVQEAPSSFSSILQQTRGIDALDEADRELGLALAPEEKAYWLAAYNALQRDPTDVELMMFAQANSEHCRHKIFKACWEIDQQSMPHSLFGMIRNTYNQSPAGVLSAYHDNAAVVAGKGEQRFYCRAVDRQYVVHDEAVHLIMKVETHNHPTAIEPFAGAGTGQGGEIRDEGATGRGAKPKAGLTGFTVSHLHIPGYPQSWEGEASYPERIATACEIMLKAPVGGAAFNNEFGRPNIVGYFRVWEQAPSRGYHKPVMIAGGMGNIRADHIQKHVFAPGTPLVVMGGPAMKIGLGGGAASSMAQGQSEVHLDFASVQRQNPEMQRRCQEVIDRCWALGEQNPILSIHDVGAGGLANALPELVHDAHRGAHIALRAIPNAEPGMTPMEIWCNESQERYVVAIKPDALEIFEAIAARERCPVAVLGEATKEERLVVDDHAFQNMPIDLPLSTLLGDVPVQHKQGRRRVREWGVFEAGKYALDVLLQQILQHPTVADKSFLITIGDRSVGGLVARDQMVGPWQVPVADCGVTATHFGGTTGEAMAVGERPGIACLDPAASARMAVAEAVQNIVAADVEGLSEIRLSCNWMADGSDPEERADLYAAVEAVGMGLCPAWGMSVPVGKDSLSMRTTWEMKGEQRTVYSPVTLVVSAFASVNNCRKTLTPLLSDREETIILFVDLANAQQRMGGSILAEITKQSGGAPPDVDVMRFASWMPVWRKLTQEGLALAYHDRSDGGLWVTLCEMAFASHVGLVIDLSDYAKTEKAIEAALLNEENGVVIQIASIARDRVECILEEGGFAGQYYDVGRVSADQIIRVMWKEQEVFKNSRVALQALWSKTSYYLQRMRDNPACAEAAYENICRDTVLDLRQVKNIPLSSVSLSTRAPRIAVLREQGVNGQVEMAAAFTAAGWEAVDVSMSDLLSGETLENYQGLAVCGGFSYGDVLGAGRGWASTILHQARLREVFQAFFERSDTVTLGVCNGCQMLSALALLIPGASHWPRFERNISEQFEARLSLVEITPSPSILLEGMEGFRLPVVVSHGEGRAVFPVSEGIRSEYVCLRYVDRQGQWTEHYPENPNGSPGGITGLTTEDGRVTIMMPHPERVHKNWQFSWCPPHWTSEESPWMRLFINAKVRYTS